MTSVNRAARVDPVEAVESVVALGANLGDRAATLTAAAAELAELPGTRLLAVSRWHDSVALTPDGLDPDKPAYLNGVAVLETRLGPHELLRGLRRIELAHGRDRSATAERWGDRTLDLDLITHGDARLATADLTLPHPRAHERDFVLRPWLEVRPDAVLDGHGPLEALLAELDAASHPPTSHPLPSETRPSENAGAS